MTIATPIFDEMVITVLDFDPDIPCDSSHRADAHPAEWWTFWTCGCVSAFCDEAYRHTLDLIEQKGNVFRCHLRPGEFFLFLRAEPITH